MKTAIVYYSLTGSTKDTAEKLSRILGADAIRIDTVKPMPKGRFQQIMYGGMLVTFGMKPQITTPADDLSNYDNIILGMPVWAGKPAAAINTLLQNQTLCAKINAAFVLSGSGDAEKCLKILHDQLPNLDHTVSLTDPAVNPAAGNETKLTAFADLLR